MGGVAGASGGRLTRWRFALNDVVAREPEPVALLLAPDDIEACNGSIEHLVEAIERAATRLDLRWPGER